MCVCVCVYISMYIYVYSYINIGTIFRYSNIYLLCIITHKNTHDHIKNAFVRLTRLCCIFSGIYLYKDKTSKTSRRSRGKKNAISTSEYYIIIII